jgi:hypothetical protein
MGMATMSDLDAMLNRAVPESVEAESGAGRAARELAVEVRAARPRRRKRWGVTAGAAGLLVLVGGGAAVAGPGLFDWSWGSADTLSVQEFPLGDDPAGQTCVMALWANADPGSSPELNEAVEKAQVFLHEHDWATLETDTSNIWAQQRKALQADGSATPALLASLTAAQVHGDLDEAGLIVPGMMISTRIDCGE